MSEIPTVKVQVEISGSWTTIAGIDPQDLDQTHPFKAITDNADVPIRIVEEYRGEVGDA